MAKLLAGLDPGWDLQLDCLAVDAGQADRPAERRRRKRDRAFGNERRAFARVDRVPLEVHEQVQVAASGAANAGFALAADADAGAFVDAGRDLHRQLALPDRPALAVAVRTGIGDGLAPAAAGRAATLDQEEALLSADFTRAAAGLAAVGAAVETGTAAAVANVARSERFDRNRLL